MKGLITGRGEAKSIASFNADVGHDRAGCHSHAGVLGLALAKLMDRKLAPKFLLYAVLLFGTVLGGAAQVKPASAAETNTADVWALAGREGGCAPLSILARKGPEFTDFQTPYELVDKLKAAKIKAEIKEYDVGAHKLIEVRVPDRGVAVMFVPTKTCTKFLDKQ